jgi:hypothetical protein
MAGYLKAYTSEWFEALMRTNASPAMHTAAIITAADREDVHSICGDQPARDYRLVAVNLTPPGTLRLCDDCLKVRKDVYGEVFMPIVE